MAILRTGSGIETTVDDELLPDLLKYTWTFKRRPSGGGGYFVRTWRDDGRRWSEYLHRRIAETPDGMIAVHRDGDLMNNLRGNIVNVLKTEGGRGRRANSGSTSSYVGVSYNTKRQKWCAQIQSGAHIEVLGYFKEERDAARSRDAAVRRLHGDLARLNLPDHDS